MDILKFFLAHRKGEIYLRDKLTSLEVAMLLPLIEQKVFDATFNKETSIIDFDKQDSKLVHDYFTSMIDMAPCYKYTLKVLTGILNTHDKNKFGDIDIVTIPIIFRLISCPEMYIPHLYCDDYKKNVRNMEHAINSLCGIVGNNINKVSQLFLMLRCDIDQACFFDDKRYAYKLYSTQADSIDIDMIDSISKNLSIEQKEQLCDMPLKIVYSMFIYPCLQKRTVEVTHVLNAPVSSLLEIDEVLRETIR